MEFVDGIDVLALLREFAARRRRVEPQLAAWIAHEVLDALDYAHHLKGEDGNELGIVHRDISPSNVLLSVRGDVKLVDFGIARAVDPGREHKSKSGTLKGKYGYMSPEQVIEHPLDMRSDVFSVGVVLAELLTGRRLFAAANELDVLLMVRDAKLARFDKYGVGIESNLAEIVRHALKKNVDERFQSAAQFRDALGEWMYEHRIRVTPKQVAEVVTDLREAVVRRRNRPPSTGVEEMIVDRAPSTADDEPVISVEGGDSLPVISVSYEGGAAAIEEKQRPISASELAAAAPRPVPVASGKPSQRAETVQSRPLTVPDPSLAAEAAPSQETPPAVVRERAQTAGGTPPLRAPAGSTAPRVATERFSQMGERNNDRFAERFADRPGERSGDWLDQSGVIELPIADTISAAVEAITMPDDDAPPPRHAAGTTPRGLHPAPAAGRIGAGSSDPRNHEDSAMRAFDDLLDAPRHISVVSPPTEEEALRKRPPTPPALADIAEPPDDAGDFGVTSPLRVLFRLMTARATGLLVVAIGGIKKEIYIRDGQPEYVSSNVASELFGNYLVTKSVLSDGELAMALAMMPHYGGKLGDTLVGLGLMKPLEVFRHLTRQVRTKIIDVCTWNKGSFGWYAGRENPREAFPLDFNAFEILGAGGMALSDDHIEAWISRRASDKLRASRTRRIGPERFEVKGLVEVCDQLDGRRSVGELVDGEAEREDRLKLGRMLCLLEACDLAKQT